MANYFPGSVLTKNIKMKIGHCANSDGQLFSRELPDQKLKFWPLGLREGPRVATSDGHYLSRRFPDKN
jgi:hypothetical protein